MSIYDVAMIIVFLGAIWFGYVKGLAWQVASVAAIVLSYFVAVTFPDYITPYISAEAPFNRFAAMLILFIGTSLIVWTLFASLSKSLKKMELKGFDRQAGALVGAVKGALLCMVITMFSVALLGDSARNAIWNSKSGYYVVQGIDHLPNVLPTELASYIHTYVENFQQKIVNENGELPPKNPIFDRDQTQQVNGQGQGQGQFGLPAGDYQYDMTSGTPTSQAGYQAPPASTSQQQWQGNYQSGTFGSSQPSQPSSQSTGYQQGTFGTSPAQSPTQWQTPQSTPYQTQRPATQWTPPAQAAPTTQNSWGNQFPNISEGENGWPDVQFNVNSKDLIERGAGAALDAGKQWLETQR